MLFEYSDLCIGFATQPTGRIGRTQRDISLWFAGWDRVDETDGAARCVSRWRFEAVRASVWAENELESTGSNR